MRGLWSLPKAGPALMRHIGAYVELISLDLARTQRELTAQVIAAAVLAICVLFAVLMLCLGVIAYTWDTEYRIVAIAWMGGAFVVLAIIMAIYRARVARASSPFLADVKREWAQDRVILEHLLSPEEE
ncbi:MAG: hypothetical protein QOK23_1666 [Gammaproteobacteria bacterium]|nr:hypothetical protein [Gammaproteobacteria bacterium]